MQELGELAANLGHADLARKEFDAARKAAGAYDDAGYKSQLLFDVARTEAMSGLTDAGTAASAELRPLQLKAWSLLGTAEGLLTAKKADRPQSKGK
ncbi:MAG TPA: hypothetical protein VNH11_17960 [Pirellulales bacterium]|nr:hypothetical protein [Pirellulales bacterium]